MLVDRLDILGRPALVSSMPESEAGRLCMDLPAQHLADCGLHQHSFDLRLEPCASSLQLPSGTAMFPIYEFHMKFLEKVIRM